MIARDEVPKHYVVFIPREAPGDVLYSAVLIRIPKVAYSTDKIGQFAA